MGPRTANEASRIVLSFAGTLAGVRGTAQDRPVLGFVAHEMGVAERFGA